jgi:hypothetical protein
MADLLELNQENDLDIPSNCAILIAEMENKAMNDAYNNLTNRQKVYIDAIREHAEDIGLDINKSEFSRAELRQVSMKMKGMSMRFLIYQLQIHIQVIMCIVKMILIIKRKIIKISTSPFLKKALILKSHTHLHI